MVHLLVWSHVHLLIWSLPLGRWWTDIIIYMQDHLEVQLYRIKASMSFDKLYLIHARTTSDGRYLWTSHDIDFDDDIQGVKMGEFLYRIMDLQRCCICHLHFNVFCWYSAYIEPVFSSEYFVDTTTLYTWQLSLP